MFIVNSTCTPNVSRERGKTKKNVDSFKEHVRNSALWIKTGLGKVRLLVLSPN